MNLRWLYFDYLPPELELSKHEQQRFTVEMEARKGSLRWRAAGIWIGVLLAFWVISYWLGVTYRLSLPKWVALPRLVGTIVLAHLAVAFFLRKRRGRIARQVLNGMGYRVCVNCGYWLRGLGPGSPSCPECGKIVPRPQIKGPLSLSKGEGRGEGSVW